MLFLETIRVSEKAKQQLIQIRRRTGIDRWNVLCRWAFCLSLSENSKPQTSDIQLDSNIEMTWRVFTGAGYENVYAALLRYRCFKDAIPTDDATLARYFTLHLHRGIGYLANSSRLGKVEDFQELIANS